MLNSVCNGLRRMRSAFALLAFSCYMAFGVNGALFAAKKDNTSEPVWVISWAGFFLFLGVSILFYTIPSKRRSTVLNDEEEKEFEEKLAAKRAALIPEEEDPFED